MVSGFDEFVEAKMDERGESAWWAILSNGQEVCQDDGRPGTEEKAWVRLAQYLQETGLRIARLGLRFRSHLEDPLPANAEGYFFREAILQDWSSPNPTHLKLVGYLEGDTVKVQKWNSPELILFDSDERSASDEKMVGESLIRNRS